MFEKPDPSEKKFYSQINKIIFFLNRDFETHLILKEIEKLNEIEFNPFKLNENGQKWYTTIMNFYQKNKNQIVKKKDLKEVKKISFIKFNPSNYGLKHYDSYIEIINKASDDNDFYRILPILLRCLFENLLYDIFSDSLDDSHKEFYFLKNQNRPRDFSQLISVLNYLKDHEFKIKTRDLINPMTIQILKEIQEIGNYTVHDVIRKISINFKDNWHDKINLILEPLLVCYKKLNGTNIIIEEDKEKLIKMGLGIEKKPKKNQIKQPVNITPLNNINIPIFETNVDIPEDLTKFYKMVSHEIKFTKGELISLVRQIGRNNFNTYLNLELRDKDNLIELISDQFVLIIFGPNFPHQHNFMIINLRLRENKKYLDKSEDYGNIEIYNQLISYINNNLTKKSLQLEDNSDNLSFEDDEINDEVQVNMGLIKTYIDMLEKGEVHYSRFKRMYSAIKNECSSISLRKELNEEILKCVSKISTYFCKAISNEDKELLKIILKSLELFTKKSRLFEILKENCDLDKLIALFEGGNRDSNLLSILFEFGYFSDIIFKIMNALDEKDIKLVNELTLIIWREHLQNETNELLQTLNKKINEYDPERDKREIKFVEKLISNLESKRMIWTTPKY